MSVSVMTTISLGDNLTTATHGISQTLHNTMECSAIHVAMPQEDAEVSAVVDSSGAHADQMYPIDVLLGFNLANWRKGKEGNVLFNDVLNTFYLRLYGVTYMVKDHSEDSERGNPQPPHGLLFPINSKGSFICTIPQTG